MDLREKAAQLPLSPGVYLYKDAAGQVIYVGKAKILRNRVRSYFSEDKLADVKTGTLIAEARDLDHILVDNEKEALALENNLIKQYQPRFNILLRDDKTYPYVKLTHERFPRVYVTRRLRKDGATYFGPFFPANLAHRLVHFIHRHFLVPSCKVDLTRFHPKPCLQFHIHRCLGPCVEGLTTDALYATAVRDTKLLLEGRHGDLAHGLRARMEVASEETRFEAAASLRDLLATVEEMDERQKMAAATGDDVDILACYAEPPHGGAEPVPPAPRADRGPPGVFLGEPGGIRRAGVFLLPAAATLLRSAVHPQRNPCTGGFRGPRSPGGTAFREAQSQSGNPNAPTRTEEGPVRSGRDQRQTQFRRAISRAEAVVEGHPGGLAGCAEPAGGAARASNASTFRTFRAPTKWPAWWCGRTGE